MTRCGPVSTGFTDELLTDFPISSVCCANITTLAGALARLAEAAAPERKHDELVIRRTNDFHTSPDKPTKLGNYYRDGKHHDVNGRPQRRRGVLEQVVRRRLSLLSHRRCGPITCHVRKDCACICRSSHARSKSAFRCGLAPQHNNKQAKAHTRHIIQRNALDDTWG